MRVRKVGWMLAGMLFALNVVVLLGLIYWNKQSVNPTMSYSASPDTNFAKTEPVQIQSEPSPVKELSPKETIEQAITTAVPGLSGIEIYTRNKKYAVEASYMLEDGFGLEGAAKQAARNFTFAAYATGLPIARTSIQVYKPDGTMGMLVTVGNKQAQTQPSSTWTDESIGPTIFINWVEQNANADYENIENHTTVKNNF